jgi:secreted trypsin-like serine protease
MYYILLISLSLLCTVSSPLEDDITINRRIVGGKVTAKNEAPYQVALRRKGTSSFGGAVVIGMHWILTAAHCVSKEKGSNERLEIVVGGRDLRQINGPPFLVHAVKQIPHPSYEKLGLAYDIALIKTKENLIFTDKDGSRSESALLPTSPTSDYTGAHVFASGYGGQGENKPGSPEAKIVELLVWKNDDCKKANGNFNSTANVCAGGLHKSDQGQDGICGGDSGGPLAIKPPNGGPATVIGITSFGMTKCGANAPQFYTRVATFLPWIREVQRTQ